MIETLTVEEAARLMGKPEQFIRIGLQRGVFPWGYAVKGEKNFSYWINARKFRETEGET